MMNKYKLLYSKCILIAFISVMIPKSAYADNIGYYCKTESTYVGASLGIYASGAKKFFVMSEASKLLQKEGHNSIVIGKVLNAIDVAIDAFEEKGGVRQLGINQNSRNDIERLQKSMTESFWIACLRRLSRSH